jgi:hypothetical protein
MRLLISRVLLGLALCIAHAQAPRLLHAQSEEPQNPDMPEAGSFTVNSPLDNDIADSVLTLREAILVANGGTSPSGLNRPVTLNERLQLTGCQFILIPPALTMALIFGGCGGGIADAITFNGVSAITLTKTLPMITDNNTALNGVGVRIDATSVVTGSTLTISASNTTLNNLVIINSASEAADVEVVAGTATTLRNLTLGVSAGATSCNANTPNAARFGAYGIHLRKGVHGTESAASAYLFANTIGCHSKAGVLVDGASFVRIGERANGTATANAIGLNSAKQILPNGVGVRVDGSFNSAVSNRIVGNVISGNGGNGIELIGEPGFASGAKRVERTAILGNDIGVDAPNGGSGIYLSGTNANNVVGGKAEAERNTLSGNGQHGLFAENPAPIAGPDVAMAYIGGNYIGTNVTGTAALPNLGHGVYLKNASAFVGLLGIAGDSLAGNRIAGNAGDGVRIEAGFAFVVSNTVGAIGASGTDAERDLGNGGDGLCILDGAAYVGYYPLSGSGNTGNRIQFNQQNGLLVNSGEAVIGGNLIANNAQSGVRLNNGANDVKLGLDAPANLGNTISNNGGNGIWVEGVLSTSVRNSIVISNGGYGVLMEGAEAKATVISATVAAGNGRDGVAEKGGASQNTWQKLETYGNGGLGIDKAVISDTANAPNKPGVLITSASKPTAATTRFGGLSTPSASVEVYALAADPSSFGEGRTFLGRATANAAGRWQMTVQDVAPLGCYTAFETVGGASSEYSKSSCVRDIFLPLVWR